ncbi:MAG: hypothetical protein ACOYNL_03830 [Rickettsiales bacterium]
MSETDSLLRENGPIRQFTANLAMLESLSTNDATKPGPASVVSNTMRDLRNEWGNVLGHMLPMVFDSGVTRAGIDDNIRSIMDMGTKPSQIKRQNPSAPAQTAYEAMKKYLADLTEWTADNPRTLGTEAANWNKALSECLRLMNRFEHYDHVAKEYGASLAAAGRSGGRG